MNEKSLEVVFEVLKERKDLPGPLLQVLHEVQDRVGHVPPESIPVIARDLNLSRAEVHGVVSFYHHFRTRPGGAHTVRVCRAEACQSMGAQTLLDRARERLGIDCGETTADGAVTLEATYCLGNCACSPAVMVDDDLHGRVGPERFDALIENLREER